MPPTYGAREKCKCERRMNRESEEEEIARHRSGYAISATGEGRCNQPAKGWSSCGLSFFGSFTAREIG